MVVVGWVEAEVAVEAVAETAMKAVAADPAEEVEVEHMTGVEVRQPMEAHQAAEAQAAEDPIRHTSLPAQLVNVDK